MRFKYKIGELFDSQRLQFCVVFSQGELNLGVCVHRRVSQMSHFRLEFYGYRFIAWSLFQAESLYISRLKIISVMYVDVLGLIAGNPFYSYIAIRRIFAPFYIFPVYPGIRNLLKICIDQAGRRIFSSDTLKQIQTYIAHLISAFFEGIFGDLSIGLKFFMSCYSLSV